MAEEEKDAQDKQVSEELRNAEVKVNGVAKSPEKQVNGSDKEDQETGVSESAGKEGEGEEAQQNGHKPEGQDSMEEAEQDGEPAEGSIFVAKCTWVGLVLFVCFFLRAHNCHWRWRTPNMQGHHWSLCSVKQQKKNVLTDSTLPLTDDDDEDDDDDDDDDEEKNGEDKVRCPR